VGQRALASADAFPSQIFPAEIRTLAPSVDASRGTVEVKLTVKDPPPFLRPDMTVSVDIEVDRRAGSLVLPAEAVRNATSKAPWVLSVRGDRLERREVSLGITGEGVVEIASGLDEAALVVLPSAGPLAVGKKVRPRLGPAGR
jgi:HlyD family secretion protein